MTSIQSPNPQLDPEQALRLWRRNRIVVLATIALVRSGFTMVTPLLPIYLTELGVDDFARNAAWSGTIISVSPLLAAFVGPFWGRLADRHGLKLMAGRVMLAFTVSWAIFGLAGSITHLMVARVIGGLLGGYLALSIPMLMAGCPKDQMSAALGQIQSVRVGAMALGPLFGGLLADFVGVRSTAFLTAAFHIVALFLVIFLYKPLPELEESDPEESPVTLRELLKIPSLAGLLATLFLASFIDRGLNPVIAVSVLGMDVAPGEAGRITGMILAGGAFGATFSAWLAGRLANSVRPFLLFQIMAVAGTFFSLAISLSTTPLLLGVFRVLLGIATGGILTLAYVLGSSVIPMRSRASGMALLSSGVLLGNGTGPVSFGMIAPLGFGIALGAGVLLYPILLLVMRKTYVST